MEAAVRGRLASMEHVEPSPTWCRRFVEIRIDTRVPTASQEGPWVDWARVVDIFDERARVPIRIAQVGWPCSGSVAMRWIR